MAAQDGRKNQDDQINYFDHLDHLDKTKDLAAKMIKCNGFIGQDSD
jgi:hypothetical protein